MIFKILPDVEISWRNVWLGAALTAALFSVGKLAIGFYLGHSSLSSSYGAAGSFVVLLVWVYCWRQILYFGEEFTQVYAKLSGSSMAPSELADPLPERDSSNGRVIPRLGTAELAES